MVLKYSFEYLSNNNTLINFLLRIADENNIKYEIIRNNDMIEFFCEADSDELTEFSTVLSNDLPMSMFLKNSDVTQADEMPEKSNFTDKEKEYPLSFCPKCLQEVDNENGENYYNPLISCDLCSPSLNDNLQLRMIYDGQTTVVQNYKEFFHQLASKISEGNSVKIETISGTYIFKKLNLTNNKLNNVLCTNLMNISNMYVAKKSEVVALASIEKPKIKLPLNAIYQQKNDLTLKETYVRYIDDLVLYLLSKELEKHQIDFLSYSTDGEYDIEIQNDFSSLKQIKTPTVKLTPDDRVMTLENSNYDKSLTSMFDKFEDKNKGHFMVLLQENNLFESSILNFYTSSLDDDNVSIYTNNIGSFLDILNYKLPSSMKEIFDEIEKDDTGKRLLENYKNKFPENFENALSFDMSSLNKSSIVSLWRIVRVLLGFEHTVLNHATSSLLEKGPRIDYKLFEQEKLFNKKFDLVKLIKSGMSFKLAGVDNNTIALGYIESYAHFISNIVDEVNNEVPLDGISLCGDIFANNLISNFLHKNITKNYKIYYNKDFVIQIS